MRWEGALVPVVRLWFRTDRENGDYHRGARLILTSGKIGDGGWRKEYGVMGEGEARRAGWMRVRDKDRIGTDNKEGGWVSVM
jgi:hypothetical protein